MKILFIESNMEITKSIIPALLQQRHNVDVASNIFDGIQKIQTTNNIDVLFLNSSTIEYASNIVNVLNAIKTYAPYVKIVLITSLTDINITSMIEQLKNNKLIQGTLFTPYTINDVNMLLQSFGGFKQDTNFGSYNFNNQQQNNNFTFTPPQTNYSQDYNNPTNFTQSYTNPPQTDFSQNYNNSSQINSNNTFENFYNFGMPNYTSFGNIGDVGINDKKINVQEGKCIKIGIFCPKGGVGKSTISKELAIAYAHYGRIGNRKARVCLVDYNLENGDIAVMLGLPWNRNIETWVNFLQNELSKKQLGNLQDPQTKQFLDMLANNYDYYFIENNFLLVHKESGLRILASPSNIRAKTIENPIYLMHILKSLERFFDVIVIDTLNSITTTTMVALENTDVQLIIANEDSTTLKNVKILLQTFKQINFELSNCYLIANEIKNKDSINDIQQYLGVRVLGVLYQMPRLSEYSNKGRSIVLEKPDDNFTRLICKIANEIYPIINTKKIGKKEPKEGLIKRFLEKLLG